jgi:hypothetical protein
MQDDIGATEFPSRGAALVRSDQRLAVLAVVALTALVGWACAGAFDGMDRIVADKTAFEYDHHLPRAYESRLDTQLAALQGATFQYCRHHKGRMPPMENPAQVREALGPYLGFRRSPSNPEGVPLSPNRALSRVALRRIPAWRQVIAFYDARPPATYPQSYYVTLGETIGCASLSELSHRLRSVPPERL